MSQRFDSCLDTRLGGGHSVHMRHTALLFLALLVGGTARGAVPTDTWSLVSSTVTNGSIVDTAPSESPTHNWQNWGDMTWPITYSVTHKTTMTVSGSSLEGPPWSADFTPIGTTQSTNTHGGSHDIPPWYEFTADVYQNSRSGSETWTNGTDSPARTCSGEHYDGPHDFDTSLFVGGGGPG